MKKTEGSVLVTRVTANVGSWYATRAKIAPFDGPSESEASANATR